MSEIMFTEFDNREVQDFLEGMQTRLKEVKGGVKKYAGLLSVIVFQDVTSHFKKEEGEKGPWKKWSSSYQKSMEKRGKAGNKILQDTGRLRQNFKPTDFKTSAGGITWFNDAVTSNGYPYAKGHDEGDGKLPQREFMWLSEKGRTRIEEQTLAFMISEGV
jgi:phage gpG-like protein